MVGTTDIRAATALRAKKRRARGLPTSHTGHQGIALMGRTANRLHLRCQSHMIGTRCLELRQEVYRSCADGKTCYGLLAVLVMGSGMRVRRFSTVFLSEERQRAYMIGTFGEITGHG